MSRILTALFLSLLLILSVSFFWINSANIELNYYFGSSELPLSVILICAFTLGALLGLLGGVGRFFRLKAEISRLKKSVNAAEREMTHARIVSGKN